MSQIDVEERETLSTSYTNTVNNRPAGQRERGSIPASLCYHHHHHRERDKREKRSVECCRIYEINSTTLFFISFLAVASNRKTGNIGI